MLYHLYVLATQLTDTPKDMQWGIALVLLILVMLFAIVGIAIRTWFRLMREE
ncbi:MAG: hypothetical protein HQ569_08805 [Actinobacteria bacterium]|nr:hypothetical protein [Actinomycetota bacterium]